MKLKALCMTMLIFSAAVFSSFALAEPAESIDLAVCSPPLPMDESWELGDMEGEPDETLPEGYFVADLWQGSLLYFGLCRSDGNGGEEILFLIDVNHDDADNLNYISGSYALSGEQSLYFMMIDGETSHGLLYCYDLGTDSLRQVLEGPCSNNAILLDGEAAGMCLLVNGDSIITLDLKTAEVVQSVSIAELGGLPQIGGSFFTGDLQPGERKYTYLEKGGGGLYLLNTIVVQWHPVSDIRKCQNVYDIERQQIADTVETEGEF